MRIDYEIDFDAPREFVFGLFTDIHNIYANLPSNIVLRSSNGATAIEEGSEWVTKARRSGQSFTINNRVVEMRENEKVVVESHSNRLKSNWQVDFVENGKLRSIAKFGLDVEPTGLLGRVLVQSIKAAMPRVEKGFDRGSARLKEHVERQFRESTNPKSGPEGHPISQSV